MVLRPELEATATAIFEKWGLDFAIVGKTTDDLRFRILRHGDEVANLPIKKLGDEAPEYDRPYITPGAYSELVADMVPQVEDYSKALLQLLASPDIASKRWVYEQYDTLIQANTLQTPGGDAGVVRVEGHATKALAFACDVTPRYCEADAFEGGKQAVAECFRNLCAVGAEPIAATDNLNFGNPEKPEIMGQLVRAIEGISEACLALSMPIVSGNVSLYNETQGQAILPTPTIGGVGLIDDYHTCVGTGSAASGDVIFLIGTEASHLGQSLYLREIFDREDGPPPPVDLVTERARGDFVRTSIVSGYVTSCHDISDGGFAVAIAEMCMTANRGANIRLESDQPHAALFGEDQSRYFVSVKADYANMFAANAEAAGVSFHQLGEFGGNTLTIGDIITISVDEMRAAHENWLPDYMAGVDSIDEEE